MKKNNNGSLKLVLIICFATFVVILGTIGYFVIFNKNTDNKAQNINESTISKTGSRISEEEFKEIEDQYRQSTNIMSIEDIYEMTRIVVTGTVSKGHFSQYDIIEFVDQYGNLRKLPILASQLSQNVRKGNLDDIATEGTNAKLIIPLIDREDLIYSSILFKNQNYNGIEISFYYDESDYNKIKEYFQGKDRIDITINGNSESADIIFYEEAISHNINLYLILDSNNKYSKNDEVKINDLNTKDCRIDNLLQ